MPDRIWCSLDVWAALGSLVDVARVVLPPDSAVGGDAMDSWTSAAPVSPRSGATSSGCPASWSRRSRPGRASSARPPLYEVYEEVIGLLSVVEPSILGVQVAYGGYVAFGALSATPSCR